MPDTTITLFAITPRKLKEDSTQRNQEGMRAKMELKNFKLLETKQ